MSLAGMQSVIDLDSELETRWVAANTDTVKPIITDNLQTPWEDLDFGAKDHIYIKYDIEVIKSYMNSEKFEHNVTCTIEVMTARTGATQGGRAHFKNMMDEVARILKLKAVIQKSPYGKILIRDTRARFNKDRGIFNGQIDVDLMRVL